MTTLIRIAITALLLVPFPITFSVTEDGVYVFGATPAAADRGRGRGGDDDDDDDRDDDDRDDDDDDGDDDDDDDDDRNDGRNDDDDRADPNRPSATLGRPSSQNSDRPQNLHLRYPNGWDEQIRSGRYILTDPDGRTVSNRPATFADLDRMREAAGL